MRYSSRQRLITSVNYAATFILIPQFPPSSNWTFVVLALSALLVVLAWRSQWRASAFWFALTLAAQACFLQLIDAGVQAHLQELFAWATLLSPARRPFLAVVLAFLFMAGVGALRQSAAVRSALSAVGSWRQWVVGVALLGISSLAVPPAAVRAVLQAGSFRPAVAYDVKLTFILLVELASAISLLLAAAAVPKEPLARWAGSWNRRSESVVPRAAAAWVLLAASAYCWLAFDALPHVPDDVAYYFHAKYFAAGKFFLPRPPDAAAFACGLVVFDGDRWYSAQLPAWPAVLAVGAKLGVPWLVNPLLAALTILVGNGLLRRLYGRDVADATVLLLALSPWFLAMSATFMGHTASLFFSVLGLYGVLRARNDASIAGGAIAGLSIGVLVNMRPLEALAVALVAGIWWLAAGWKNLKMAPMAATVLCGVAMLAGFLAYNKAVTGDARVMPFEKVTDENLFRGVNRVGFGKDVGSFGWEDLDVLPGHGPIDVLVNTNHNLSMVNFEMFAWPCGSLLLVFVLLARGRYRDDGLLWGLAFGIWAAMSCYWFSGGPDFGARYWYQMIFPLAALTVRSAQHAGESGAQRDSATDAPEARRWVWALVAMATLMGALNLLPWRALDKYRNYRYVRGEVRALARQQNFGRSLVFIRSEERDLLPWQSSSYASAFSLNPPTLDPSGAAPIYVRELGPESAARIRAAYPDRPVWIVQAPEGVRGRFHVVEGPLPALQP